jgi:L-ribulokinase
LEQRQPHGAGGSTPDRVAAGPDLYTTPGEIYRALIEATAFGALAIISRFEEYGVKIEQVINCGGIAEKNPLVMQIYADVTGAP